MRDIFFKYLTYGGIENGPNMFQGGYDKDERESMDNDQIIAALAQTSISADKNDIGKDTSLWAVDFEGVMKGFLSRRAPYYYGFEVRDQVEIVTKVLANFMRYLLYHDVCPEYAAEVSLARDICGTATRELWACAEAQRWLPGDFNIACSTLFDGSYGKNYDGVSSWMPEENQVNSFVGMTTVTAQEVVKFAIAGAGSEAVYRSFYDLVTKDEIVEVETLVGVGFEITAIDQVEADTKNFYREQTADYRPVGKVRAKPWTRPDLPPEDLTAAERAALAMKADEAVAGAITNSGKESVEACFEFFIEEVVLQHLFVGMKIEATVHKLNCGIWFFDDVLRAFCSFDTFLCNELMIGWKEPRPWVRGFNDGDADGEEGEHAA